MVKTTIHLIAIVTLVAALSTEIQAQEAEPMDIPTLELFIDAHKAKYKKLDQRVLAESAKLQITQTTKSLSEQYEELHKELGERYNALSAWTSVGLSALRLMSEVRKSYTLIKTFGGQVKYIDNIYVLREYMLAIDYLQRQCKYLTATVKKLPALRADPQSLTEVIFELQTVVSSINLYLDRCNFIVRGYKLLQDAKFVKFPIVDQAKIATQIIRDFSK